MHKGIQQVLKRFDTQSNAQNIVHRKIPAHCTNLHNGRFVMSGEARKESLGSARLPGLIKAYIDTMPNDDLLVSTVIWNGSDVMWLLFRAAADGKYKHVAGHITQRSIQSSLRQSLQTWNREVASAYR